MEIRNDLKEFINTLPKDVTLVAATKYIDATKMRELYEKGINNFGENRVDAFLEKYEELKDLNITWHFIGHLQRNKALKVIDKIDYLHSLDSLKLAKIINDHRTTPLKVFVEISINNEENKDGVSLDNIDDFIANILKYKNIKLVGLMMMSVKASTTASLDNQFQKLEDLRNHLQSKFLVTIPYLSMGMSDDYQVAIAHHTTHIRLGRILFKD